MPLLLDRSLWVDFTRPRTPRKIKQFVANFVFDPDAHLAEPIVFEILRCASPSEAKGIRQQFQTIPILSTHASVWNDAIALGQACKSKNLTVNSFDLIIAAVAIHHNAEVVTFDGDFVDIASVSQLNVKLLNRPTP